MNSPVFKTLDFFLVLIFLLISCMYFMLLRTLSVLG